MDAAPLDPGAALFGAQLDQVRGFVEEILARMPDLPPHVPIPAGALPDLLRRRPPSEHGRPLADLLDELRASSAIGFNPSSGRALSHIPNGGLPTVGLADLISNVLNKFTGFSMAAPALVRMEAEVIDWVAATMGMPRGSAGILTSGGSIATLSALACARDAACPPDLRLATIYVSEQTHFAAAKAAHLVGFSRAALRQVASDPVGRMVTAALVEAIASDRRCGRHPVCIVATGGSTSNGAVDPLEELADIAARERIWLHVDAAYGGFFMLTARGQDRLAGIGRADSVVLDPHKGLFLPFGTGCLLVRDAEALRRTHAVGDQMHVGKRPPSELPDFAELSPELSRPYRGLRLWLALNLHGVSAFRQALDCHLDMAQSAWEALARMPGVAVQEAPTLSIVTFRAASGGDAATERILQHVNADGSLLLTSTELDGKLTGRIGFLNPRTTREHMLQAVRSIGEAVAAE